jgi:hypothetical protein
MPHTMPYTLAKCVGKKELTFVLKKQLAAAAFLTDVHTKFTMHDVV